MMAHIRGWFQRPESAAFVEARQFEQELAEKVVERTREADEMVRREEMRRQRLSGAFIFDGLNRGVIDEPGARK